MWSSGVLQDIPANQWVPDYGAHGILRLRNRASCGTGGVLRAQWAIGKGNVARVVHQLVSGAREAARAVRP